MRETAGRTTVTVQYELRLAMVILVLLCGIRPLFAQQRGQYVPGRYGLNAGVIPDPGFTYQNLALNYSASQFNNQNGNALPNVTGTYSFWLDENIFTFVPDRTVLGGHFMPYAIVNVANGPSVAATMDLRSHGTDLQLGDTFVELLNFGWHLDRADFNVGYGFMAPTGRYSPGDSNNIGSGYWGHNLTSGSTIYITENKRSSANVFVDWEIHGRKSGTDIAPGQALTVEWGFGQIVPLDEAKHILLQLGLVGYDQWQATNNSGVISFLPYYSAHAVGFQTNLIVPVQALSFFFKYYGEYSATNSVQGRSIIFGGSLSIRVPRKK